MVELDASLESGGGGMVRAALALAAATGTALRLTSIRKGDRAPGLLRRHLSMVAAVQRVCSARIEGDFIGSTALAFEPRKVTPGEHAIAMGNGLSPLPLVQAVLPALLMADAPSRLVVDGATHGPGPSVELLERGVAPLLERMGASVRVQTERLGFAPAAGGRFIVDIAPAKPLKPLHLLERGRPLHHEAHAFSSALSERVAERELAVVKKLLNWDAAALKRTEISDPAGPGNALVLELAFEQGSAVFSAAGSPTIAAEALARGVCDDARRFLASEAAVCRAVVPWLIGPMALAGAGGIRTLPLERGALAWVEAARAFTGTTFATAEAGADAVLLSARR